MKKNLLIIFIAFSFTINYAQDTSEKISKTVTTYYLIRHAEKENSNTVARNPNLSEKGIKRAENWATIFKNVHFDAVYSSNYNRTKLTANPIAKSQDLETEIYNVRAFDFEDFKTKTLGKTILIVGHSNTTPSYVNNFIRKKKYIQIDEHNYSNLYIITFVGDTATSTLLKIN